MSDIALESSHGHFAPLPSLTLPSLSLILSARRQTMATFARHLARHKLQAAPRASRRRVYDSLKLRRMTHNIAIGKTCAPPSYSPFPSLSEPSISRRRMACNYFYDFIQRQFVSGSPVRPSVRGERERGLPFDAPFPSSFDFYGSRVTQLARHPFK